MMGDYELEQPISLSAGEEEEEEEEEEEATYNSPTLIAHTPSVNTPTETPRRLFDDPIPTIRPVISNNTSITTSAATITNTTNTNTATKITTTKMATAATDTDTDVDTDVENGNNTTTTTTTTTTKTSATSNTDIDTASKDTHHHETTASTTGNNTLHPTSSNRSSNNKQVLKALHTVKRLEVQRRPSGITVLGALVKQLFIEKKISEDGMPVQVVNNLYLGSIGAAMNLEYLTTNGFTHILCVANQIKPKAPDKFTYKTVDVLDAPDCPILQHFEETYEFIEQALSVGKILVHCFAGMSRSVTIVSAYLMKKYSISAIDALKWVRSKREQSNPNAGFIVQLVKYQATLNIPYRTGESATISEAMSNVIADDRSPTIDDDEENGTNNEHDTKKENDSTKTTQIVIENESGQHQPQFVATSSHKSSNVTESIPQATNNSTINNDNETKVADDNKGADHIARLSINSKTLKAWDRGKRPSLFTAIEKLKRLKMNAQHRREESTEHTPSNSISFSEDKQYEVSISSLVQEAGSNHLEEPSPSLTPITTPTLVGDLPPLQEFPAD